MHAHGANARHPVSRAAARPDADHQPLMLAVAAATAGAATAGCGVGLRPRVPHPRAPGGCDIRCRARCLGSHTHHAPGGCGSSAQACGERLQFTVLDEFWVSPFRSSCTRRTGRQRPGLLHAHGRRRRHARHALRHCTRVFVQLAPLGLSLNITNSATRASKVSSISLICAFQL